MNRKTLVRGGLVSLLLGTTTIACTPDGDTTHVASASEKAATAAVPLAAKVRVALAKKDGRNAVRLAEVLVTAQPNNADYRVLLGQSYLADGRFASAEGAFRDTLTIAPDQPRAAFDLALAEIAQGHGDDAKARLAALDGKMSASDLGLALALAGDRTAGIAKLTDVVRDGKSDARVRQNLALAYALDGRWGEARGMAMQDTPPDRIGDQIAGWAALAGRGGGAAQVAAMLGVTPAIGDPGVPTRLALAGPSTAAPVALALADAPAAPLPPVEVAAATPAPIVSMPLDATPGSEAAQPANEAPTPAPTMLADAGPVVVPAMLTPAPAPAAKFVRVAAVVPPPVRDVAPGRIIPSGESGFVVQLGAYARAGAIDTAWAQASRLSPRVATFAPVRGQTRFANAALVRLSVSGFATRAAATSLCGQIKARGADCFVRAAAGDAPLIWVRRDTKGQQLAMR